MTEASSDITTVLDQHGVERTLVACSVCRGKGTLHPKSRSIQTLDRASELICCINCLGTGQAPDREVIRVPETAYPLAVAIVARYRAIRRGTIGIALMNLLFLTANLIARRLGAPHLAAWRFDQIETAVVCACFIATACWCIRSHAELQCDRALKKHLSGRWRRANWILIEHLVGRYPGYMLAPKA